VPVKMDRMNIVAGIRISERNHRKVRP
jgi:hypothetical protein